VNVSLRWLEAFLRRRLDARDVADRLTMLGAPVDAGYLIANGSLRPLPVGATLAGS